MDLLYMQQLLVIIMPYPLQVGGVEVLMCTLNIRFPAVAILTTHTINILVLSIRI